MEFLFTTVPETGHTVPVAPFAAELVRRGHRVRWYTGEELGPLVRATGAEFVAMPAEWAPDQAHLTSVFPERAALRGLAQARFDLEHLFIRPAGAHVEAMAGLLRERPAQAIVGDTWALAAGWLGELTGTPSATIGVNPLLFPGADVPPAGLGLRPLTGPAGRVRDGMLNFVVRRIALAGPVRVADDVRAGLGLPRDGRNPTAYAARTGLYLQLSPPAFEFPRGDLPEHVHFLGHPAPSTSSTVDSLPDWRPRLTEGRPVVLVTQGTIATDPAALLRPAIAGLAGQDVLVIAVTGGPDVATLGPLPENVLAAPFLPFDALLPHVDVMVTNGGFGGVQRALAHAIPLVVAGTTEDKKEVNVRVAHSGAGIDLRTSTPTAQAVADAVRTVLREPKYALSAAHIRDSTPPGDPASRGADLLERLAGQNTSPARETTRRS